MSSSDEVAVYFDLRSRQWSITSVKGTDNRGKLIGKATSVTLTGCRMVVKESRRRAIAAGGHREVCAWVIGTIAEDAEPTGDRITFRPHEGETFIVAETGQPVRHADAVTFASDGKAYAVEVVS
jgi:hypothetical protein